MSVNLWTIFFILAISITFIFCNKNENPCVDNYDRWRLIGGHTAQPGQFPFMASIRNSSNGLWGGASIIDKKWVLTAAHCVAGFSPTNLTIVTGSNLISSGGTVHYINKIVINPDYDDATAENDIALLELENEIIFDDVTQPVELGSSSVNDSSTVLGWGLVQWGVYPDKLQFLTTRVTSVDECQNYWKSLKDTQLCAFSGEGKGACCGDSGGPLLSSEGKVVGMVSYGVPCALGSPDIYTRVSSFIDWIHSTVQ